MEGYSQSRKSMEDVIRNIIPLSGGLLRVVGGDCTDSGWEGTFVGDIAGMNWRCVKEVLRQSMVGIELLISAT